jgi:acetyl-CoA carboxylase carboxyl transferase subunit alpha
LKSLGLIDQIIDEPLGGAHRDHPGAAQALKQALRSALKQLSGMSAQELVERRFDRLMSYGRFREIEA